MLVKLMMFVVRKVVMEMLLKMVVVLVMYVNGDRSGWQ